MLKKKSAAGFGGFLLGIASGIGEIFSSWILIPCKMKSIFLSSTGGKKNHKFSPSGVWGLLLRNGGGLGVLCGFSLGSPAGTGEKK